MPKSSQSDNYADNGVLTTETVKLTDNDHMTGTFTIKVYPWDSTKGLTVLSSTPVQTVTGTLTAERVTLASKVPGAQ